MLDKYSNLVNQGLDWKLRSLETASEPRCIVDGKQNIMLCANNYLNLTTHKKIVNAMVEATKKYGAGSGSVRAIAGNMQLHEDLELTIAEFKGVEAALTYSAGYTANVGLIPTLVENSQDLIISDELNHGSIIDGVRLTKASKTVYPHNDTHALESILKEHSDARRKLIITDGVFSMDGDIAPLKELARVCKTHDALLVVDDAHGIGVLGPEGRGSIAAAGLSEDDVPVLIGTLGKAVGTSGAFVAGPAMLMDYLVQKARTYIYTTAMPPAIARATCASIDLIEADDAQRRHLGELIAQFRRQAGAMGYQLMPSDTPIQPIMVGDNWTALALSKSLEEQGLLVTAIRPPTVPEGEARLRVTLSAAHTWADLDRLLNGLSNCRHLLADTGEAV